MTNNIITFTKLHPDATLSQAYAGDSGYDISAHLGVKAISLEPLNWLIINTGISLSLPPGIEAQIRSRSGLAAKHGIFVLNSPGTIDPNFIGEIKVILMNLSKKKYFIKNGERIAQICFAKINNFVVSDINGNLISPNQNQRLSKGLGSSDS
jgi:dUTP pyrophosphatase